MDSKVLSIAGFDGSGGAGLQADLKTFSAFGCYGMTVLTALPVQNTTGVRNCYTIPISAVKEQLDAIFEDIVPDAIKIGMLFNTDIIEVVAEYLAKHAADIPIVLDPVMISKSGDPLLLPEAVSTLKKRLIPLVTLITPNLPEATVLTQLAATTPSEMENIAEVLLTFGSEAVLLKGGHLAGKIAADLYWHRDSTKAWLSGPKILTQNTHGTGCTLSAAIASALSLQLPLLESCKIAKHYLQHALEASNHYTLGHGAGPVHHFYHLWPTLAIIQGT